MNYISLFSSAGVGCYGFNLQNFDCIATSELIERRMNVQKANNKAKYEDSYILGDITQPENKGKLYNVVKKYKNNENVKDVDVIVFTPPCQGMSVANHKKNDGTVYKNSLVIDALEIVEELKPRFFVAENVARFMNTTCIDHDVRKKISQAFHDYLSDSYEFESRVINFKNFGSNSSRTRTLVIGVRKDISKVAPQELFPYEERERTLKEVIGHLPNLSIMGEISKDDIFHSFRPYRKNMRDWICDLEEGESAFDNEDPLKRPHQIRNGEIVPNVRKNGDKYTRQRWDKVAPCIHTRNDILASQSTVHPEDDRVFSIRELMLLMNIPYTFKWTEDDLDELNQLSETEKAKYLKLHAINIRQSIGEAVPPVIMEKIAKNIKKVESEKNGSKNNQNYQTV